MKRAVSLILLILIAVPLSTYAEDTIRKDEQLNLEQCAEISLKMHPGIAASRSTVNVSKSRVGQAESNYYPQIDASAGFSRVSPASRSAESTDGSMLSNGSYDQYSGSLTLRQTLFDFGKTRTQVNIQNMNLDSSKADLLTTEEQVLFNTKQAYFGVLKAKRNRDVAAEAVGQFRKHLEQAKGFYEVGTKPKFDVTKAEVDLSNAKLNLIRAENSRKIAMVTLNNAMGVPDAPEYTVEDNLSFQKYDIKFDEAVESAYKNRPDLRSLAAKRISAEQAVELAKKGYYPVLSGNAGYNRQGERFPLGEGWNLGVALSVPVFSGFLTKNQIEEAKANLDVIKANEEALKQNIFLEVQQAYLNLAFSEESIGAAELTVRQAAENFEIANGRYEAGVGNPIEVTDAEVSLSNAKTAHIQALYDYRIARASMEKAIGIK